MDGLSPVTHDGLLTCNWTRDMKKMFIPNDRNMPPQGARTAMAGEISRQGGGGAAEAAKKALLLSLGLLLAACGGGGEEDPKRTPLPPAASRDPLAIQSPDQGSPQSHESATSGRNRDEGLKRAKQLREQCFTVTSGDGNFWWCAAGTYYGVDAGTGQACSTTLTGDGHVSFVNGSTSVDSFKVERGGYLKYEKPAGTSHWNLLLEGQSGFGYKRFKLTVDTSKTDQIRIHQYKRNLLSTVLDNTCITQF